MKNHILYTILFGTLLLLSSCYPTIHFPDRVNTPGFREKKEAKLVAAFKIQPSDSATNSSIAPAIDAGYAITDHIGVIASYRSLVDKYLSESHQKNWRKNDTSFGGRYNANYVEGAVGYYSKFARVGQAEVYLGAGGGSINREGYITPQYNFDSKYYKIFVQPAMSITPGGGKVFRVGAGFRLTMLKYYDFNAPSPDTKYIVTDSDPQSKYRLAVDRPAYTYFEPFINLEVGYKFIKFNAQLGASGAISENSRYIGQSPYLSFGLVFHYAPRYLK